MDVPRFPLIEIPGARNTLGTLAPFTGFLVLLVLAHPHAWQSILAVLQKSPWTASPTAAILLYVLVGLVAGKLVGALGVLLTQIVSHVPTIGDRYAYRYWYEKHQAAIDELYQRNFSNLPAFDLSLTDRVNALKSYLRAYDPKGHAEITWQFVLVDITRGAFVYAGALLLIEIAGGIPHGWRVALCVVVLAITAATTPRRIAKVTRAEMVFLVAAQKIKEDRP